MVVVWLKDVPEWCNDVRSVQCVSGRVHRAVSRVLCLPEENFYLLRNGRVLAGGDSFEEDDVLRVRLRLRGGKGGFGSMLRGSGGTKKTTNYDACRDLNGRRLRDNNEQKRLATWRLNKQRQEQERAAALVAAAAVRSSSSSEAPAPAAASAQPSDDFDTQEFESRLGDMATRVSDSVAAGINAAKSGRREVAAAASARNRARSVRGFTMDDNDEDDDDDNNNNNEQEELAGRADANVVAKTAPKRTIEKRAKKKMLAGRGGASASAAKA